MASRRASRLPLAGLRVVEMAHHLAAPIAAMHLADFGADVVKVESLEGDDWRRWGPRSPIADSLPFLAVNRNKRSLSLDLGGKAGRSILARLLRGADVFITNYMPEALADLGLEPRRLTRRYPRLVACAVSAFGRTGPDARRRAFDLIVGGETALLIPHPDPGGAPLMSPGAVIDISTSLLVAYGVMLALFHRARTGRGQAIETALVNAGVALQAHRFIWMDADPEPPAGRPQTILYAGYPTRDGFVTVAALAERLWRRLAVAIDLGHLVDDPRYAPWRTFLERQEELRPLLTERFRSRSTDEWLKILIDAGVPAGRVKERRELFADPQLLQNHMVLRTRHPQAGPLRMMGFPVVLSATPARLRVHAPALGRDTRRILGELGYPRQEVARLVARGVVRVSSR